MTRSSGLAFSCLSCPSMRHSPVDTKWIRPHMLNTGTRPAFL
jgi:hypothetical protein